MIESVERHNDHIVREMNAKRAAIFRKADSDADGTLSTEEMKALVDNVNEKTGKSLELEEFAARLDKDADGNVTAEDFEALRGMQRHGPWWTKEDTGEAVPMRPAHSHQMFSELDADKDGALSEEEIGELINRAGQWSERELDAAEVLGQADENGDGLLSREEAKALIDVMGPPRRRGFGRGVLQHYHSENPAGATDGDGGDEQTTSLEI